MGFPLSPRRIAACCLHLAASWALLAACATSPSGPGEALSPTGFSLVLLRTGERDTAPSEDLIQRRFAFIETLKGQGRLLLEGPFGPDKHRSDLRGFFLIDESDPVAARALAGEDPATKAGFFRPEVIPITTLDVIRYLPQAEEVRRRRRMADGVSTERPDVRSYAIVMAPEGEAAAEKVLSQPAIGEVVVLMARMGSPRDGELFAILDVPTAEEARARLKVAGQAGLEIHASEWYGTPALAELVQGGGASSPSDAPPVRRR